MTPCYPTLRGKVMTLGCSGLEAMNQKITQIHCADCSTGKRSTNIVKRNALHLFDCALPQDMLICIVTLHYSIDILHYTFIAALHTYVYARGIRSCKKCCFCGPNLHLLLRPPE